MSDILCILPICLPLFISIRLSQSQNRILKLFIHFKSLIVASWQHDPGIWFPAPMTDMWILPLRFPSPTPSMRKQVACGGPWVSALAACPKPIGYLEILQTCCCWKSRLQEGGKGSRMGTQKRKQKQSLIGPSLIQYHTNSHSDLSRLQIATVVLFVKSNQNQRMLLYLPDPELFTRGNKKNIWSLPSINPKYSEGP